MKLKKIRCDICGCWMYSDQDADLCECCVDELYNSQPTEDIEE